MTRQERLAAIVADCHERGERGERVDPEEIIRANPDLADELRSHFELSHILDRTLRPANALPEGTPREIGEYRIVREIGRGGMGVVYEAVQVPMQRRVALKLLSTSFTQTSQAVQRFQREARAAGRLHHTNIVPIHAMGQYAGLWYYAMELVDGRALNQVVGELKVARASGDTSSISKITSEHLGSDTGERSYFLRVAELFAGVAEALETAHRSGIIHRDIKPSNLLLDPDGLLMIVDFGLARLDEEGASMTMTGDLVGTPAYMSPEQALAEEIDPRTDTYSLGATMYEVLTLRPPFQGKSAQDICAQIQSKDPPPPRRFSPQCPKDLETIVFKAMEKDRDARYASTGELAQDLRRFAAGAAIGARRIGPLGVAWRKVKRHKMRSALIAVALLLAILAGVFALAARRDAARFAMLEYARLCALAEAPMREAVVHFAGAREHGLTSSKLLLSMESESMAGQDARRLLSRAIDLAPERFEAYLARAIVPGANLEERLDDLQSAHERGLSPRAFHLARAYLLGAAGRWDDANAEQARAASFGSRPPTGVYFEARLLELAGSRKEALGLLDEVVRDAPLTSVVRTLALHRRARIRAKEEDFAGAMQDLNVVQGMGDDSATTQALIAQCWRKLGNEEQAERRFQEALRRVRDTDSVAAWYGMCGATWLQRDWHEAVTREAVARHKDSLDLLSERMEHLLREGKFEQVKTMAERALATAPDSSEMQFLLGTALSDLRQPTAALAAISRAVKLDPSAHVFNARGIVYKRLGRFAEALADFERGIAADPLQATLHSNRGVALRSLGRIDEARAAYDHAIRLNPAYAPAYAVRGGLLWDEFRDEKLALADFDRALSLDPRNALALGNKGTVLWARGEEEKGLALVEQALGSEPWHGFFWKKRAQMLAKLGRKEAAAEGIARALQKHSDFDMLHECGHAYQELGMHRESLDLFRRALGLRPKDPEILTDCGIAYIYLEQRAKALQHFEAALELDPDEGRIHYLKARVLKMEGRLDEAVPVFRRAAELKPTDEIENALALALLETGQNEAALEVCDRALKDHADNALLHGNRGIALRRLKRFGEAIAALERACELNKSLAPARWHLGDIHARARRFGKALELYREVAALDPENPRIWNSVGWVCTQMRRWKDALEAHRAAADRKPNRNESYQAHAGIAFALQNLGRVRESVDAYRLAVGFEPGRFLAWSNLGQMLDLLKRHDEAARAFTKVIELQPKRTEAYTNRGLQYFKLKRHADAVRDLRKAAELGGTTAQIEFLLGLSHSFLNRYEDAERAFTQAIRLAPAVAMLRLHRAVLLVAMDRFEDALEDLRVFLKAAPRHATGLALRAVALASLGRFEEAEAPLERSLKLVTPNERKLTLETRLWALVQMGRFEAALESAEQVPHAVAARIHCLRALGRTEQARKVAEESSKIEFEEYRAVERIYVLAVAGRRKEALDRMAAYGRPWQIPDMLWRVRAHAVLGDADAAIEWLGRAIEKGHVRHPKAAPDPDLALLGKHPRFRELLAKRQRRRAKSGK